MNLRSSCTYSAPIPKMPPGLVELMEGLARDVLKNNPTEVYTFCAEHMQKLLQIRNGSNLKKLPTLEQKIDIATKKIRERAAQRRDDYDKKMQLLQHVQSEKTYNDELMKENYIEATQYILGNIVKIPQNDLTNNIEHEIIAGLGEGKFLSTEPEQTNELIIPLSETQPEDNLSEYDNEKKEPPEIEVSEESIRDNGDNPVEEKNINKDETIIDNKVSNVETQKEDALEHTTDSEKEQSDSNVFSKSIGDNATSVADEKLDSDNQDNVFKGKVIKETEEINCKEIYVTANNTENAMIEIEEGEHKNHDTIDTNNSLNNNEQKRDEKISEVDITLNRGNDNTINEIHKDEKALTNDNLNNIHSVDSKNNYEEVKNMAVDETADNAEKIKRGESQNNVNNNLMDLETAAITIQKVFRSFLFRNKTSSIDESTNIDMNLLIEDKDKKVDEVASNNNVNKDRRALGISRMDTVLQTVNEEKSLSLSTDDSSTLSSAATIIQAHVRGFLVRNKFNLNKTTSSTSGIDSDAQSMTSFEGDIDCRKNKTVLNIHIVPEGGHFMSRDESMLTSIDLSLDGSPPGSTNLHPLGYDKSERRKQLKREDAIQSISPPSNNSGKLSEDVDSVKEMLINGDNENLKSEPKTVCSGNSVGLKDVSSSTNALDDDNISTMINNVDTEDIQKSDKLLNKSNQLKSLSQMNSDEMDVVTPFITMDGAMSPEVKQDNVKLIHSGECHDVVLPTKVSRNDASVVREFQNVLVYFLLWNN